MKKKDFIGPSLQLVRVAIPVPLTNGFDYQWPGPDMPPLPGCRVRVPFGKSQKIGIVLEHPTESCVEDSRLKPVLESIDSEPIIARELLENLLWAADYYHHPVGEVLSHALPTLLRKGRSAELAVRPSSVSAERRQPVKRSTAPELTIDQRSVLATIDKSPKKYKAFLLKGVTGSGKTEIYLNLIARHLTEGRQTLLLVPEIGLTPQLVSRLNERFGERLALMHSKLSPQARLDAWQRARSGDACVLVGTRSAVFAPIPNPGLIIVDEEHDSSFKQQDGFKYSARDLAVFRARQLNIPIILASATPSLESFQNAQIDRYQLLTMPRRIGSAGAPSIRMIDLNQHATRHSLSTPLIASIETHLAKGNQVLLFLNRRGFAPTLFCPECNSAESCPRCDAHVTVHARKGKLCCHHCGKTQPLTWSCTRCHNERVAVGSGTQRVTDELKGLFPDFRIARLDRDTTVQKGSLDELLGNVHRGKTQILVGTQMLTKGHDFPRVTLVGILNADQGLFGTDFRSSERLAQTILQVAGRAGRRARLGEVLVQTHCPKHPLLMQLLQQDYTAVAELILQERRRANWPPFSHLAVFRAEASQREPVFQFLDKVRAQASKESTKVSILGPAPAIMERRAGRYRGQLLFQSPERIPLHDLLGTTIARVRAWTDSRRVRWAIDVDPIEL
ncbi:MAG: primosomal protein N' [Gammaproteobacteria bacterium]